MQTDYYKLQLHFIPEQPLEVLIIVGALTWETFVSFIHDRSTRLNTIVIVTMTTKSLRQSY